MTETTQNQISAENPQAIENWVRLNNEVIRLGLEWFHLVLEEYIQNRRSEIPPSNGSSENPVITDLAADWLLRSLRREEKLPTPEKIKTARNNFDNARKNMEQTGEPSTLDRLSKAFGLSPFDEDVMVMGLAPFAQAGFSALLGYAHDRSNLSQGTPHLALALFTNGNEESEALARERFSPNSPLRRYALIETDPESTGMLAPFRLGERIGRLFFGEEYCDSAVEPLLGPVPAGHCPTRHQDPVNKLAQTLEKRGLNAALILGPKRCGKYMAAARLAGTFGMNLVEMKPNKLSPNFATRRAQFNVLSREAILGNAAVVINLSAQGKFDSDEKKQTALSAAEDALRYLESLVIVISDEHPELPDWLPLLNLHALTALDRMDIWSRELAEGITITHDEIEALSEHFALGPGEIASLCKTMQTDDPSEYWSSGRKIASRGLDDLAEKIESGFTWEDLQLPEDLMHDLKAIAAQVRHRSDVYNRGGFGRKLIRGRGVSVLFAGSSGVGKTMAAEVIANELDLGLYKIDLSSVISKYIGETEKNLKRVFDAAEAGGAVLFFDEADALFGKRSEVKDSHDRYANIEVSYLLQRMESYKGLSILATNMKSHIDVAFLRRLRFVIDIPFPSVSLRTAIWQRAFPEETKTENLDFSALGRLELAGGNIVVIAVNAAFLAAAEGAPVNMSHIARSAQSEMRKLDKEPRIPWI
ncbi:MAG: ATP-binding protein [Candidatus Nitronauta litoralis]|uniref:ATP-binding protein n=1 Tax=Candidatus Nitronauta litoralis TaxID=2705533 RepID=A0A7T0BWZ6_9BACT|nr:MAG: ATP-binding protein [Candidatus Nitronauta litoralis]